MVRTIRCLGKYKDQRGNNRFINEHSCAICSVLFRRDDTLDQDVKRPSYCSELCKAKAHIHILENGCWELKSMRFVWNGRACSVRAILYERAFNLSYEINGLAMPRCGRKSCSNPIHLHAKEITATITLEGL
jgi:hypothetical protein